MKRPHEERDRMLVSPIVIVPDLAGSSAWKERVRVWAGAIEEILDFDLVERSADLWNMVVGINRCAISLLAISSAIASRGRSLVRWEHVEGAYKSIEFSTMRGNIEEVQSISLGGDRRRSDLICPFESTDTEEYLGVVKGVYRSNFSSAVAIQAQSKDIQKVLRNVVSVGEVKARQKSVPRPRDAATLVKSAEIFRDEVRMGRRR